MTQNLGDQPHVANTNNTTHMPYARLPSMNCTKVCERSMASLPTRPSTLACRPMQQMAALLLTSYYQSLTVMHAQLPSKHGLSAMVLTNDEWHLTNPDPRPLYVDLSHNFGRVSNDFPLFYFLRLVIHIPGNPRESLALDQVLLLLLVIAIAWVVDYQC